MTSQSLSRKRKLSETPTSSSHGYAPGKAGKNTFAIQQPSLVKILKRGKVVSTGTGSNVDISESSRADVLDPLGPETPDEFLKQIMAQTFHLEMDDSRMAFSNIKPDFFDVISKDEMQSYPEVVAATRQNNVAALRELQEAGHSLNCCNPFGESLIHIACRRGFVNTVNLLLAHPCVSVRVVDDCGRTPLHDLCWNPSPQLEICKLLLERDPSLLFFKDKRNFTPFEYCREEHGQIWKRFLLENKSLLEKLGKDVRYAWMFSTKD